MERVAVVNCDICDLFAWAAICVPKPMEFDHSAWLGVEISTKDLFPAIAKSHMLKYILHRNHFNGDYGFV